MSNDETERWEEGDVLIWQLWDGDEPQTFWPVTVDERVIAVCKTQDDRKIIISDHLATVLLEKAAEWVTTHLDRCAKTMAWRPDKAACTCGFDDLAATLASIIPPALPPEVREG